MSIITNNQLSIIIVNYNTERDLKNCLHSIYCSYQNIAFQVWVVDNGSEDNSCQMVYRDFPNTILLNNNHNLGFAAANNLALKNIDTEFVLLLNPDTIVCDHAFDDIIKFLKNTPEAGMATCKLVKADGTLDLACRRSFPSAADGFFRACGLSKLFPKSKLFSKYNLTYLDENKTVEVQAINGAFMMVKMEAVRNVGFLDEDYFMYGEDLDWCFRFNKMGWKIFYVPTNTVTHLKGQSGGKKSFIMIHEFFKSMELFCRKNYLPSQSQISLSLTIAGIKSWKLLTLFCNTLRKEKRVTP